MRGEGGGEAGRATSGFYVYGLGVCWVGGEIQYVLHVISFEENTCLSYDGISARDARVAVEVVYHHIFLVFGQRSVHDGPISHEEFFHSGQKRRGHTAYLLGERGRERERKVLFFQGGTVSEVTIPVHQRTSVYSLSAVFHRRIVSSRSRPVDLSRLQRRRVGRNSCGRVNR